MVAKVKNLYSDLTQWSLIRFCIVGGLGFLINLVLLTIFYKNLQWSLFLSQILAGEVALFSNFLFHHHWTYKGHNAQKSILNLLIQFHATSWTAIIGTALLVSAGVTYLHLHYVVSLFVAGAIALSWNYIWSRFVIWRHHDTALTPGKETH